MEPFAHKCPYCDNERNFVHGRYKETCSDKACIQKHREATNLGKYGNKCSLKGSNEQKVVDAIIEKYGVDNVFKLDSMQQVAKQRMKEKYGKEYSSQVPEIRQKVEDTCMRKYGYKTNLLNPEQIEQIKRTCLEKYGNEYVCASEHTRNRVMEYNTLHYGVPWFMQTKRFKDKTTETCLQRYGVSNVGYIPGLTEKRRATNLQRYGIPDYVASPYVQRRSREVCLEKYGVEYVMQNPDAWKRITSGTRTGGFMSKSEAKFASWCDNYGITYKYDEWINGKHWDFTIYNNGHLDFIVEIDGEWCHGLIGDSDGKHQVIEKKNIERLIKVPAGVKYLCTNSIHIKDAFNYMLSYIDCDIKEWGDVIYQTLPVDFPYPAYTDYRLNKDFQRLCTCRSYKGSDLGMCAMYHFHKSLYTYHLDNMISPVDAWHDKDLLKTCIYKYELYNSIFSSINMISYFYVSHDARLHSITSPGMIKCIIEKYLIDANTIVDLFAYTGNTLLGCASLGKQYIGYAINETCLSELKELSKYYQLNSNIYLDTSNIKNDKYDALLSCIPIGEDPDTSIDWCLHYVRCNAYVFLVRNTVRYTQYIVDKNIKYGDNAYIVSIPSHVIDKLP